MGSSSKKKGMGSGQQAQAAPPPPTMGTTGADPNGVTQQYYANLNEVPQAGGFVLPQAPPGMAQGIGRNFYTPPPPPPPPPRMQLAQSMSRPVYEGRGARGMSGAYGNSSRSGRSNDR